MELFIQIKNGLPFGHPIFGDNFRQAFPDVDTKNLPSGFALFERVEAPTLTPYEVYEGATYELDGDVYKDVHHVRPMTDAEKEAKIVEAKARRHPDNWVFNEAVCAWQPPQE